MLKRNGESRENGAFGTLNRGERDAYIREFAKVPRRSAAKE